MNPIAALAISLIRKEAIKIAKRIAYLDQPDVGEWRGMYRVSDIGVAGERILGIKIPVGTKIYRVDLDPDDPLRFFHTDSGIEWKPTPLSFALDFGSIPWMVRGEHLDGHLRLTPINFREPYLGHDAAYLTGTFDVRKEGVSKWATIGLTRMQADALLFWFLSARCKNGAQANRLECQAIYRAVRFGAEIPWKRHRARDKRTENNRSQIRSGQWQK